MTSFKLTGKEFNRIKVIHERYLKSYAAMNKGSIEGATPLSSFYVYWTYVNRYSDSRACAPMGYR